MNLVYKMTFESRLKNKTPPYYYVGSKTNCFFDGKNIIDEDGKIYKTSSKVKELKDSFLLESPKIEILYFQLVGFESITEIEEKFQRAIDLESWHNEYFNLSYANGEFTTYGKIWTVKEKSEMSSIMKASTAHKKGMVTVRFKNTGRKLTKEDSERKSIFMKTLWSNEEYKKSLSKAHSKPLSPSHKESIQSAWKNESLRAEKGKVTKKNSRSKGVWIYANEIYKVFKENPSIGEPTFRKMCVSLGLPDSSYVAIRRAFSNNDFEFLDMEIYNG